MGGGGGAKFLNAYDPVIDCNFEGKVNVGHSVDEGWKFGKYPVLT